MGIADKYEKIKKTGYILSVFFLSTSILLYFLFNIRKIICDLSGITEKHAINRIRAANDAQTDSETGITARTADHSITNKIAGNNMLKRKKKESEENETLLLENNYEETTLLQPVSVTEELTEEKAGYGHNSFMQSQILKNQFMVLESIVIVHTDIII